MYQQLLEIDAIKLNLNANGQLIINFTLAFIMFGVALGIKIDNFKQIFISPKSIFRGLIAQFILLPMITFALVYLAKDKITQTIAMGLILVAACPGGNISNFISSISKGNVELSISLTAIGTVLSIFLTPLNFKFWGSLYSKSSNLLRPLDIPLPDVFTTILIILGLPLILGMIIAWRFPIFTKSVEKKIQNLSVIIFLIIVAIAFAANFNIFIKYIKYVFVIVLIHNFIALATGYLFSTITKSSIPDRRTIAIETGIQNSGLAIALILNPQIFPQDIANGGMIFVASWWGIWHIISGLLFALLIGKLKKNDV